jgi:hypothetical protein
MKKKTKIAEFKADNPGWCFDLSGFLLKCAYSELALALDERLRRNLRLRNNHCSFHALGSIVLLATGFDAWLNEGMKAISMINEDILEMVYAPTMEKYYGS